MPVIRKSGVRIKKVFKPVFSHYVIVSNSGEFLGNAATKDEALNMKGALIGRKRKVKKTMRQSNVEANVDAIFTPIPVKRVRRKRVVRQSNVNANLGDILTIPVEAPPKPRRARKSRAKNFTADLPRVYVDRTAPMQPMMMAR